jgi:hypothetical protein
MDKLHIAQDDYGYWMLSWEKEDGSLSLLAHHAAAPDHLIEQARELNATGKVKASIIVDPPRPPRPKSSTKAARESYKKPVPRKAGG